MDGPDPLSASGAN